MFETKNIDTFFLRSSRQNGNERVGQAVSLSEIELAISKMAKNFIFVNILSQSSLLESRKNDLVNLEK